MGSTSWQMGGKTMAVEVSVFKELVNKFINLGGVEKKMYCSQCNDYTVHLSVSFAERAESTITRVTGRLSDFNPMITLGAGTPYICLTCRRQRLDGGVFSDVFNNLFKSKTGGLP
jgi:hypothetical protein